MILTHGQVKGLKEIVGGIQIFPSQNIKDSDTPDCWKIFIDSHRVGGIYNKNHTRPHRPELQQTVYATLAISRICSVPQEEIDLLIDPLKKLTKDMVYETSTNDSLMRRL